MSEQRDIIDRLRDRDAIVMSGLFHATPAMNEAADEIERLRARLASASERVAEMQAEAGMYHSLYDVATERLASARKALEEIASNKGTDVVTIMQMRNVAISALTDEKST